MEYLEIILSVSVIVSVATFVSTAYLTERWKKGEFGAKMLDYFDTDVMILEAKNLLDYLSDVDYRKTLSVHYHKSPKYDCHCTSYPRSFNSPEQRARNCFDKYLDFLVRLQRYIIQNMIDERELIDYAYWLEKTKTSNLVMHYIAAYCPSLKKLIEIYERMEKTFDQEYKKVLEAASLENDPIHSSKT